MLKRCLLSVVLTLVVTTTSWAVTTISAGNHLLIPNSGLQTFAITASSDSGETLQGIDLYLVMDALGPMITKVDLINGTVFEPNNVGQFDYGLPEHMTPTRQPSYYTTTASNSVPLGVVALITIDTNGVAPGVYTISLDSPLFGPSAVYNQFGEPGSFANGTIGVLCPEPGSVLLAVFGLLGFGVVAIRRRRASATSGS